MEVIEDLDISGFSTGIERPGLKKALSLIEDGFADTLVIFKIDRLARSIVTFHQVLDRVEAVGGRLVSVSESLDFGTPAGRLVASVLASFAEFESQTISARVKGAQQHLESIGKWRGGRRPFGWTPEPAPDGKGLVLVINEEEASHIRSVVGRVLSGDSLSTIAGDLNLAGVLTSNGKPWRRQTLLKFLRGDRLRHIIGEGDYVLVQKVVASRQKRPEAVLTEKGLLSGPICGRCGNRLRETAKAGRRIYACQQGAPGIGYCGLSASADRLEETVVEKLLGTIGKLEVETPQGELVDNHAEERAELVASLASLEADNYIHGLFRTPDDQERYRSIHALISGQIEDLPAPFVRESDLRVPTGQTFSEVWDEADEEERKVWVDAMLREVLVLPATTTRWNPERVSISFR